MQWAGEAEDIDVRTKSIEVERKYGKGSFERWILFSGPLFCSISLCGREPFGCGRRLGVSQRQRERISVTLGRRNDKMRRPQRNRNYMSQGGGRQSSQCGRRVWSCLRGHLRRLS